MTYTLDPQAVEARITPYTKAILVVHIFGQPADMDGLLAVARRHGLPVIEDCAQATGGRYRGQYVGTIADVGCFSFGDGKQIIGGDGGMVLTNDAGIHERACAIGSHPARQERDIQDPALTPYIDSLTYTYRIHPLAAVIIREQLRHMDAWNAERRVNHERLSQGLVGVPGLRPVAETPGGEHVYHRHSPTIVPNELGGVDRATIVAALEAEGVPANLGYVRQPVHLRARFQDRAYFFGRQYPWAAHPSGRGADAVAYRAGDCPVAEQRCATEELRPARHDGAGLAGRPARTGGPARAGGAEGLRAGQPRGAAGLGGASRPAAVTRTLLRSPADRPPPWPSPVGTGGRVGGPIGTRRRRLWECNQSPYGA